MMTFRFQLHSPWENIKKADWETIAYLILATIVAVFVRLSLLGYKSADYETYTKIWYNAIQTMGISALRGDFSNYNPPYLYLLYLVARFLPGLVDVVAIKFPSLIADFVCAGFIYKIVSFNSGNRYAALFAYCATLLSLPVILNSSFWGQADSIYTAGLIASLYFLMTKRNWLSFIAFGVAFAFKLQSIFFLPILIALWFRKEISWKYFLAIPIVYFISILPAWIIGRPIMSIIGIYFSQAGEYNKLTSHAPNLYAWFPIGKDIFQIFLPAGIALAVTVILIFILIITKSKTKLSPAHYLEIAFFSVLIVPFVLPKMHQRYFFPADILSIAFGFYFPTYFYVPIIINLVSFFSYQYFLFGVEPYRNSDLALVMFAILAITASKILRDLYITKNEEGEENSQQLQIK
jgi:Gpi18-like mannosyltransferase